MLLAATLLATALASPTYRVGAVGHTLTHPGATAGLAWTLSDSPHWSTATAVEVGAYWHPDNQVATWVRGELSARHQGERSGIQEAFAATGPLRATWAVPSVRVDGDTVRPTPLAGDTYWTATAGLGLGRRTADAWFDEWVVRPQVSARFPHSHGIGWDVLVEVGFRFGGEA